MQLMAGYAGSPGNHIHIAQPRDNQALHPQIRLQKEGSSRQLRDAVRTTSTCGTRRRAPDTGKGFGIAASEATPSSVPPTWRQQASEYVHMLQQSTGHTTLISSLTLRCCQKNRRRSGSGYLTLTDHFKYLTKLSWSSRPRVPHHRDQQIPVLLLPWQLDLHQPPVLRGGCGPFAEATSREILPCA